MPITNYCKKCKAEVPALTACPYCGAKLAKTGERLSFVCARVPARDAFAWQGILRVLLPAFLVVGAAVLGMEFLLGGYVGLQVMLREGFPLTLALCFAGVMALAYIVLRAQGVERVHVVLDKDGAHAFTYLDRPTRLQLAARLLTRESLRALQEDAPEGAQALLVQRRSLAWAAVRRVQFCDEPLKILLYRPRGWLTMAIRCPAAEYAEARAYARKKLARLPEVKKEIAAEKREEKRRAKEEADRRNE